MEERIVIIDGNSLINRAYYAIQRPMITKEGLYTHGVYGFLNMLTKIEKDYEPGYMVVAFDRKAPTFRHQEYEEYKAGRKSMPPELAMQLPLLKEVLQAMRICMLEIDGFEADDIIGTVAKKAEENGLSPLIITGDRDELQLASRVTKVLITKKGISEFELYDEDAMMERYGFTPEQFIDYKGLAGDSSDNIPGVPGIGDKTATRLILEYGSVENLIENLDSMPEGKLKEKIRDHASLAMMSKRLATIFTQVPIDIDFSEFRIKEPDYETLLEVYKKLEFNRFMKKLSQSENGSGAQQQETTKEETKVLPEIRQVLVDSEAKFHEMTETLRKNGEAVLKVLSDHSHTSIPFIYGIALLTGNTLYYTDGANRELLRQTAAAVCDPAFGVLRISGHELKKDYYALLSAFPECREMYPGSESVFRTDFDTEIAAYLLNPARSSYSLSLLAYENLREEIPEEEQFLAAYSQMTMLQDSGSEKAEYCGKCCCMVLLLREILSAQLKQAELERVFYEAELPLVEVLASMETHGFRLDKKTLQEIGLSISEGIEKLTGEIYLLAGEEFNINSPLQLGNILFEKLGLPAGKKTKKGYSTNAEILEKLRPLHPIIEKILEYRTLSKLKSTYIDGLIPLVGQDGRIHAHFQQTVTATGRISCTEPNLQNIPIRQELGRSLRKAFTARDEGECLVGADYSQIELRILAHLSGDEHLILAFNQGEDIHKSTAAKVFDVPLEQVTPEERSAAKAVNFGVIYGMSSFGLSSEIHVSRKEAERYIEEYFRRFPGVKHFMEEQVENCKKQGFLLTIMGRRRYINEIHASSYSVRQLGERLAMNSPIQGSAADIIKLAMISVYRRLRKENIPARLILQVHDELILETPKEERERVAALLASCMENVMPMKVKLSVGVSSGENWYQLK